MTPPNRIKNGLWSKHSPHKAQQHPHAILDTDGKVMTIRDYHRKAYSNSVVPLPYDDESTDTPVTIGWFYIRGYFHSPCGLFKIKAPPQDVQR